MLSHYHIISHYRPPSLPSLCANVNTVWRRRTCLDELLQRPADTEARQRLRSASSMSLVVRLTRLSTARDRTFPIASARPWNSLPSHVIAAPSLFAFRSRLKSHLFSLSYTSIIVDSSSFVQCPRSDLTSFVLRPGNGSQSATNVVVVVVVVVVIRDSIP